MAVSTAHNGCCDHCGSPLVFTRTIKVRGKVRRRKNGGPFVFCRNGCRR